MKGNVIQEKSFVFAVKIVKLVQRIQKDHKEYILTKQLLRSGTNPGAMSREATHAESRADFAHKYAIALKEANETEYWLELMGATGYLTEEDLRIHIELCKELIRILTSIVKTTRNRR